MTTRTRKRSLTRSALTLMAVAAGSAGAEPAAAQAPLHPTRTHVVCNTHGTAGRAVSCGVSVSDRSLQPTAPTGTVVLTTNLGTGHGTFSNGGTCTLVPVNSRTSRCAAFTYTPTMTVATRVYGNYLGDVTHATSNGHADINGTPIITPPPPPPPVDDESFADLQADIHDLTAALRAGNRPLAAQIRADIQQDVRSAVLTRAR